MGEAKTTAFSSILCSRAGRDNVPLSRKTVIIGYHSSPERAVFHMAGRPAITTVGEDSKVSR
jgi:hypothetical protein